MNNSPTPLCTDVIHALRELRAPALTDYQLGQLVYRACRDAAIVDHRGTFAMVVTSLMNWGLMAPVKDFPSGRLYSLIGQPEQDPRSLLCTADPFGHLSHLSAMEYHGLTDRISSILYVTSPPNGLWDQAADERMQRDLGDSLNGYRLSGLPILRRIRSERLGRFTVRLVQRKNAGAYIRVERGELRISSLGRTFLDMLTEPDLCGGIRHVVTMYQEHAVTHAGLVLAEIDRHGSAIDKVRAGYILEQLCDINDPVIDQWQKTCVQRGGSRKLDAGAPYAATYSERWGLSLNQS